MSNLVYPAYPDYRGLAFTVLRAPAFDTITQRGSTGAVTRINKLQNPRWHWSLNYNYLKDFADELPPDFVYTDFKTLVDFLLYHKGQYEDFLFRDPDDEYVGPGLNSDSSPNTKAQLQLVQDLVTGVWYSPIQRRMAGQFWEDISDINGVISLYANGVLQGGSNYIIGGPGLGITGFACMGLYAQWTAQPATPITADFHFYWRVRCENDRQDLAKFMPNLWAIGGDLDNKGSGTVNLVTVRNASQGYSGGYPPPPTPPLSEVDWYSCPISIIPAMSYNDIIIVTTDDAHNYYVDPPLVLDKFYLAKYDNTHEDWLLLYTENLTDKGTEYEWWEPDIGIAWKGPVWTIALYREKGADSYTYNLQIFTFVNGELANSTVIVGSDWTGVVGPYGIFYDHSEQNNFVVIDNLGHIHVFVGVIDKYDSPTYLLLDLVSTDNGATFNPIAAFTGIDYENTFNASYFQTSDGKLYLTEWRRFNYSLDNGATWAYGLNWADWAPMVVSSDDNQYVNNITPVNGVFFGIIPDALFPTGNSYGPFPHDNAYIVRATSLESWDVVAQIPGLSDLCGGAFTHDGTYYYWAAHHDYSITLSRYPSGNNLIYRSEDGISWDLIANIPDDSQLTSWYNDGMYTGPYYPLVLYPTQLIFDGSALFFSYYYSTLKTGIGTYPPPYGGTYNIGSIIYWKSTDHGVTWTAIPTPFQNKTWPG